MVEKLFERLSAIAEVEAIALGGSRAGETYDEKSDYDVYLYCTSPVPESVRKTILAEFCCRMEIGNHFWEYEDNCTLKNGIDIDILYRNLDDFIAGVASVVEEYNASNGYTTCMWHNLLNCKIIIDKRGRLKEAKKRFDVAYPEQLKKNILDRNMKLLHTAMPAYDMQIAKALKRGDTVSINHRTAAFMESYFDIIFAMNELTHPGEKRLVSLCKKNCATLPANFEGNIEKLYKSLFTRPDEVNTILADIVAELKKVI